MSEIDKFAIPPSPAAPSPPHPSFTPHFKTYDIDPDSFSVVLEDVARVSQAWKPDSREAEADIEDLDVMFKVLKTTTPAIWPTRSYLFSLPDESVGTIRAQFRPETLAQNRPVLPSSSSSSASANLSTSTTTAAGYASQVPMTLIRRATLEVFTDLRHLDETYHLPLSDDGYDMQSDGGHSNSKAKPETHYVKCRS